MFKFIKEIDTDNEYDKSKVVFEIPDSEINLEDLREVFNDFCKACGYSAKQVDEK